MSLEEVTQELTKATQELTKAILTGRVGGKDAAGVATPAAGKTGKAGAGKTGAGKLTADDAMAAAVKVKNQISKEAAQFLIQKHGGGSLKDMKPTVYAAFIAECEKSVEDGEVEGMEEAGEDDDL